MNKTPRTRLVTLMAAAAGVTAALGASISTPELAHARTAPSAMVAADTVKNKTAPAKAKAAPAAQAKAKSAATSKPAAAKKAEAKPVVATGGVDLLADVNADGNADGTGY